jgi:hypothetical protein
VENIKINLEADTTQLNETIKLLEKLGQVDAKTAAEFKAATVAYQQRTEALKGIQAETAKAASMPTGGAAIQSVPEKTIQSYNGLSTALKGARGSMLLMNGAMSLAGNKSQELVGAVQKVHGSISLLKGVSMIPMLISSAMQGVTLTTGGATTAMKAFNTAVKANPIGYLLSAITAVIIAVELFSGETEDATEATEKYNEELEKQAERLADSKRFHEDLFRTLTEVTDIYHSGVIKKLQDELTILELNGATREELRDGEIKIIKQELEFLEQKKQKYKEVNKYTWDIEAKYESDKKALNNRLLIVEAEYNKTVTDEKKKAFKEAIDKARQLNKEYIKELDKIDPTQPKTKLRKSRGSGFIAPDDKLADAIEAARVKSIEAVEDINNEIEQTLVKGAFDIFGTMLSNQMGDIEKMRDAQNEIIDEQLNANNERRNKEMISEREFRANEKELLNQKVKNEEAAQKKLNDAKKKQDIANKVGKLFDIGAATAKAIIETTAGYAGLGPLGVAPMLAQITAIKTLAAIQTALLIATPLPKYAKGTLSLERGNNALGVDTIPILANEGEAITPTAIAREYRPTLAAMHKRSIPSQVLNSIANNYHKNKQISTSFEIDYDKLGESLSYYMRDSNNVKIKNVREFADALRGERHNVFIH